MRVYGIRQQVYIDGMYRGIEKGHVDVGEKLEYE